MKQPEITIVKVAFIKDGAEVEPTEEALLRIYKFVSGKDYEKRETDSKGKEPERG